MKRVLFWIIILMSLNFTTHAQQQGYDIDYTLHGVHDSMAWLCQVYGNEVYAIDSTTIINSTASFSGEEEIAHGVYKIVFNDTLFTDIIFTGERIILESRLPDIIGNMRVHKSEENRLLFGYWQFYFQIRDTLDDVIQKGKELFYASQGKPSRELDKLEQRSDDLEKQKIDYIINMKQSYPDMFAPRLIWAFQKPDYRFYLIHDGKPYPSEKEYYQKHFFDRIDFTDSRILYTEVLFVMINDYMRTFAEPPSSSTYITLIDEILSRARVNPEVYQYCIELFIQNFEISVWEKVFIHLVENHYLKSPLGNPTLKRVYSQRIQAIRNTSVGAKAPDICGTTVDGTMRCLSEELGTRTVLLIWNHGCDHCEDVIKGLIKVKEEYKEKGLNVFSFSLAEDPELLQQSLDELGMTWVNVTDLQGTLSTVVDEYNVSITPVMYLLDQNGIITDKPTSIPVLYANLVVSYRDQ